MALLKNLAESLTKRVVPNVAESLFPAPFQIANTFKENLEKAEKPYNELRGSATSLFTAFGGMRPALKNLSRQARTGKFGLSKEEQDNIGMEDMMGSMGGGDGEGNDLGDLDSLLNDMGGDGGGDGGGDAPSDDMSNGLEDDSIGSSSKLGENHLNIINNNTVNSLGKPNTASIKSISAGEGLISEKVDYQTVVAVGQSQQMLELNSSINKSLEMLASFQAEQTMEHYRQSEDFYKISSEYNSYMRENYELIFDHYRNEKERRENEEKNKRVENKEFSLDTLINPERLMKKVMDGPVGMIFGEMGVGMMKGEMAKFTQDPLGTMMTMGLSSVMGNIFEKQIQNVNRFFETIPYKLQNMFTRWSKNADSGGYMNSILGAVGNFLKIDLGTPNIKLNKVQEGKVDFDGKTRDSIIRGIPMYLAQIAYNTLMTSKLLAHSYIVPENLRKGFVKRVTTDKNYSIYNPDTGMFEGSRAKANAVKKQVEEIRNNNAGVGDEAKYFARNAGASKSTSAFFARRVMEMGRGGDASAFNPEDIKTFLHDKATREEYIKNNTDKKRIDRDVYDENFFNNVIAQPEFKNTLLNVQIDNLLGKINVPDEAKVKIREELLKSAKSGTFHKLNFGKLFDNDQLVTLGLDSKVNEEIANYSYTDKDSLDSLSMEGIKFNSDAVSADVAKYNEAKAKTLQDRDLRDTIKKIANKADLKGDLKKELEDKLFNKAVAEGGNLTKDIISKVVEEISNKDKSFSVDSEVRTKNRIAGVINNEDELNASIAIIQQKLSPQAIIANGLDAGNLERGEKLDKSEFVDNANLATQIRARAMDEENGGKEQSKALMDKAMTLQQADANAMNDITNENINNDAQAISLGLTGRALNTKLDSKSYISNENIKWTGFGDMFKNLFDRISGLFDGFFKGITDMFSGMFNGIRDFFKDFSFKMFSLPDFKLKWSGFKKKVSGKEDFGSKTDAEGNPIDDGIIDAVKARISPTVERIKDKVGELLKFNPKDENGEYKNVGTMLAESVQIGVNKVSQSLRDWLTGEDNTQKSLGESVRIRLDETVDKFKMYLLGTDDKEKIKDVSLIAAARVKLDDLFGKRLKLAIFGEGADNLSLFDNIKAGVNKATSKLSDMILGADHANRKGEEGMSVFRAISIRAASTMDEFKDMLTGGAKLENGERPSIFSAISTGVSKLVFGDNKDPSLSLWDNIKISVKDNITTPVKLALLGDEKDDPRFKDVGVIGAASNKLNKWMFGDDKAKEAGILANIRDTLGRFTDVAIFGLEAANKGDGLWSNIKTTFRTFTDDIGRRFSEGVWEPTKKYFVDLLGPTVKDMFSTFRDEAKHYLVIAKDWFSTDFLSKTEGFMGRVFGDDVAQLFRENIVVPIKKLTEVLTDSLSKVMKFLFRIPLNFFRGITDTIKLKRLKEGRGNYSDEEKARLLALDQKGSTFDFNRTSADLKAISDRQKLEQQAQLPQASDNSNDSNDNSESTSSTEISTGSPITTPPSEIVANVVPTPEAPRDSTPSINETQPLQRPVITAPPVNAANPLPQPSDVNPLSSLGIADPIGRVVGNLKGADLADIARNSTVDLLQQQKIATATTDAADRLKTILDHIASIDAKVQGEGGKTVEGSRPSSIYDKIGNIVTAPFRALMTLGSGLATGVVKLAKLPGEAIAAIGTGIANIGTGILKAVPSITRAAGNLIENLAKVGSTLFDGLGTVATKLADGAIRATEGLFKFGAEIAGPVLNAVGDLAVTLAKGLAPAAEALGKGISKAVEGLIKFSSILLDKGLQAAMWGLEKGAKLLGLPFTQGKNPFASSANNVTNWNDLLMASRANPLHVYVVDGKIQTYKPTKRTAKTGLNNADISVAALGNEDKNKKDKDSGGNAIANAVGNLASTAGGTALGTAAGAAAAAKLASIKNFIKESKLGRTVSSIGSGLRATTLTEKKDALKLARANTAKGIATARDLDILNRYQTRDAIKNSNASNLSKAAAKSREAVKNNLKDKAYRVTSGLKNTWSPGQASNKPGIVSRAISGIKNVATSVIPSSPGTFVGPPRPLNTGAAGKPTARQFLRDEISKLVESERSLNRGGKATRVGATDRLARMQAYKAEKAANSFIGPRQSPTSKVQTTLGKVGTTASNLSNRVVAGARGIKNGVTNKVTAIFNPKTKTNAYAKTLASAQERVKLGTATKAETTLVRREKILARGKKVQTVGSTLKDKASNAVNKVGTKLSGYGNNVKALGSKVIDTTKNISNVAKTKVAASTKDLGKRIASGSEVLANKVRLGGPALYDKVSSGSKATVDAIKNTNVAKNAVGVAKNIGTKASSVVAPLGQAAKNVAQAAPAALFNTFGNNVATRGAVNAGKAVSNAGSSMATGVSNVAKKFVAPGVMQGATSATANTIANGISSSGSALGSTVSSLGSKASNAAAATKGAASKISSRLMDPSKGVNFKTTGLKGGLIGAAASIGGGYLLDKITDKGSWANESGHKAIEYAGWGATVGSILPGIGTVLGAGIGAVAGVIHGTFDKAVSWIEDTFGEQITSATQSFLEFPKKIELWAEELPLKIDQFAKDLPKMIMDLFASGDEADALENPDIPVSKPSILGSLFKAFGKAVWALIENLPSITFSIVKSIPKLVIGLASGLVGLVFKGITGAVTFVIDGIKDIGFSIVSSVTGVIRKAFDVLTYIPNKILEFGIAIKDFVAGMFPNVTKMFTSIVDSIKNIVQTIFDAIKNAVKSVIKWIPGGELLLNTIDKFTEPDEKGEGVLTRAARKIIPAGDTVVDAVKYSGMSESEKADYDLNKKKDRIKRDKARHESLVGITTKANTSLIDITDKVQSIPVIMGGSIGTAGGADTKKIEELTKPMEKFSGTLTQSVNANESVKAGSAEVNKVIDRIADKYGIDKGLFHHMAMVESSKNPNANKNSNSIYKGLYQIGSDKLKDSKLTSGVIAEGTGVSSYGLSEPDLYNPQVNAEIAAKMMKANTVALKANSVPINPTMLYVAHQQGASGAVDIYRSAMDGTPPKLPNTISNIINNVPAEAKGIVDTPSKFLDMWDTIVKTGKTAGEGAKAYFAKVSGKEGNTAGTKAVGDWSVGQTAASGSSGFNSVSNAPISLLNNNVTNSIPTTVAQASPLNIPKVSNNVGAFSTGGMSSNLPDNGTPVNATPTTVAKQADVNQVIKNADTVNASKIEDDYRKAGYTGTMLASGMNANAASETSETVNLIEELRKQTSYLAKIADNTLDNGNMFSDISSNISNMFSDSGSTTNNNVVNMNSKQTNVKRSSLGDKRFESMKPSENAYILASGGSTSR